MRLWLKILLATGAAIAICLVVAGLLASLLIRRQFDRFVQRQEYAALQRLGPSLADYYERTGSWAGLDSFLGRRGRMVGAAAGMRLLLLDQGHRVLLDTQNELVGQVLPQNVWASGEPIVVGEREVGRLVSGAGLAEASRRSALEVGFLTSMGWAMIGAGVVGALAAIVVTTILALQITAPARDLTQAARRLAIGDRESRVATRSHDELGEVGSAFNEMAAALAHQEELRQHLVADVAHELRTPLAVMRVELESLQDGLTVPTPETVASLGEEVSLLARLVEDLHLLAGMEAGQLSLQPQPVLLAATAQNVLQQVNTTAERKGVALQAAVPTNLPAARADPDRLQQVLLNLLGNALRYTPAGGTVRLSAQAEGSSLHLQVADTGEGIAPQDLPHVFDRFYRADASRSRATGGSGLGLTIARGLVEAMGGRIWAESALGQGTTIHFTLPIA